MSMTITLRQPDGTLKTFTQPFVSGMILRRTLALDKQLKQLVNAAKDNDTEYDTEKDLELALRFVCETFGNQFASDELLAGLPSHEVYPTYHKLRAAILTGLSEALGVQPEPQPNAPEDTDPNA